ncbi:hypothetical protein [Nannocystis punicea]|uniref:Leucine-rich repeat domain-containing protein n=1 Tax=Nannocystis punicea TaxID=2995304 RepID=A0ABY7GVD9_9BACT|nr:hypothetical protein [Nannocystis poenicansa]WAS90923.1 hypothetical protein O0S08_32440 [Nannocystis poenicansa]
MSRLVLAALALVTCGPRPPVEQDEPMSTTTGATGSSSAEPEPTTSPAPLDCDSVCDVPWTHDGDLEITPATDPAALRCLRRVTGDLTIRDFSGPLPAELLALRDVDGLFALQHNDGLVDLAGLECLRRVDGLIFEGNDALIDLAALTDLESSRMLFAQTNGALADLSPLSGLAGLELLDLNVNPALQRLPTLPHGTRLDSLVLWGSPLLTDLDPLAGLEGTPGQILLEDLPALTSLAGLSGMFAADDPPGELVLGRLPALASLSGLESLQEASALDLHELPQITSLAPLAGLRRVERFDIGTLPALASLVGLDGLEFVDSLGIGGCSGASGSPLLLDLTGLGSLGELHHLALRANVGLQSLAGLTALAVGPDTLVVTGSPNLPAEQFDAFVAAHGVPDVCQDPQDACACP